jgi:hypothetical protein
MWLYAFEHRDGRRAEAPHTVAGWTEQATDASSTGSPQMTLRLFFEAPHRVNTRRAPRRWA